MRKDIAILLYKHFEGSLTTGESRLLDEWKSEDPEHQQFFDEIQDEDRLSEMLKAYHPDNTRENEEEILTRIEQRIDFKVIPLYRRPFFRIAVAASVLLAVATGGYFILKDDRKASAPVTTARDIPAPSADKAVITLASGKQILVDTLTSYTDGSMTITRTADGKLVYANLGSEVNFQTLSNPRGSKVIDMTLSDGSHIWLNAGSSITYPTAFTRNERKISMDGEAYFEVAHDEKKPFTVSKNKMAVTVLGTSFNVNAYDDEESIKVTLLEGSVRVGLTPALSKGEGDQQSLTIKPNQQAVLSGSALTLNHSVNTEEVMAWKNGQFLFNRSDMKTIMRELARWYDVQVEFKNEITDHFRVRLSRNENVSKVFEKLEETGRVKFEIQNKKIIVSR